MSDYARNHDFSVKDGLTTGDPNKLIKGSEVDDEFDDIVTHIATKIDEPAGPSADDLLQYTGSAWSAVGDLLTPTGAVLPFAGTTLPTNWLWCDGSAVSQTTYADLYGVIGVTYGDPGGGNFNLPDLRGRAVFGKDDMNNTVGTGGGDAARLTSASAAGVDGDTLGDTGGVEEHVLTLGEMPSHDGHGDGTTSSGPGSVGAGATSGGGVIDGNDEAHTNVPPAIVLNYIIRI